MWAVQGLLWSLNTTATTPKMKRIAAWAGHMLHSFTLLGCCLSLGICGLLSLTHVTPCIEAQMPLLTSLRGGGGGGDGNGLALSQPLGDASVSSSDSMAVSAPPIVA